MDFHSEINGLLKNFNLAQYCIDTGLLNAENKKSQNEWQGNCITGHPSKGEMCLSIKGILFKCFNCDISGNAIHFIQDYVLGERTPKTFWKAINIIEEYTGQKLNISARKTDYSESFQIFQILTDAAKFYNETLTNNEEYLEITKTLWGFGLEEVESFNIGFATGKGLFEYLKRKGHNPEDIISSGLFYLRGAQPEEFFVGRIIFPYKKGLFTRYMIGRSTSFTPERNNDNERKYKKLLTHSENFKHVSKQVKNDLLYNIDAIRNTRQVVLTEGVADTVSLSMLGIPTISPVTKKYSKNDFKNIKKLIPRDVEIIIINDNDLNNEGQKGANSMAEELTLEGYQVKNIEIPLDEERVAIREIYQKLRRTNGN